MVKLIGAPNPGREDPLAGLSEAGSMLEISLSEDNVCERHFSNNALENIENIENLW
jgi:hypothetical protein